MNISRRNDPHRRLLSNWIEGLLVDLARCHGRGVGLRRLAVCLAVVLFSLSVTPSSSGKPANVKEQKRLEYQVAKEAHALLETWVSKGVSSGLSGTIWDNRDDGHSKINLEQLPGMKKHEYSQSEAKTRGWGLQLAARQATTVGNSSTAHKLIDKGSQPRCAYSATNGLAALRRQFKANNIYIYPSHMDHISGNQRLGRGQTKKQGKGRGDMYPTNTPYLIISQGSSGTDQPFIRAIAWTIGSFPLDVRKKLEADGLLMSTVQMILRRSQLNIHNADEYLSGLAHPAVFNRRNLDPLKMMRTAKQMRLNTIPPSVQLRVLSEDQMLAGRDFIGPARLREKHFDSPEVISRIWRGFPSTRTMKVSATETINPSGGTIKFHWIVLRGPADKVKITPLNTDESEVEITIEYPGRTESSWINDMWSNRVDIGVFAESAHHISAPSFITWMTLDNEQRNYADSGDLISIAYGTGRYVDPRLSTSGPFLDTLKYSNGNITGIHRTWDDGEEEHLEVGSPSMSVIPRNGSSSPPAASADTKTSDRPLPNIPNEVPSQDEIDKARDKMAVMLEQDLNNIITASNKLAGAQLYVALTEVAFRASARGDVTATTRSYDRIAETFKGNFTKDVTIVVNNLFTGSELNRPDTLKLCLLALSAQSNASTYGEDLQAVQLAEIAVTLARRLGDVSLQRTVTRQLAGNSSQ